MPDLSFHAVQRLLADAFTCKRCGKFTDGFTLPGKRGEYVPDASRNQQCTCEPERAA